MGLLIGLFAILFYSYFIAYFAMGLLQPIGAICRILSAPRKDSPYAIGLKRYLLAVAAYIIGLCGLIQIGSDSLAAFAFLYFLVIPWGYAIWYINHVRHWNKKLKNIEEFDRDKRIVAPHKDRLLMNSYPKKTIQWNSPLKTKTAIKEKPQLSFDHYTFLNTIN